MTECNRRSLTLSKLGRQKIVADFDGECLTAGGILMRPACYAARAGGSASLAGRLGHSDAPWSRPSASEISPQK